VELRTSNGIRFQFPGRKIRFFFGFLNGKTNIGSTPHPVTITTRIITSLVGNLYKPSVMKTTMNQAFAISFVEMLLELEKKSQENHHGPYKKREHF